MLLFNYLKEWRKFILLYDYQYDVAAIIVLVCMLFFFSLRKTFMGKSGRVFVSLIICDLIAAVLDWISCYTISYPDRYPLYFNYIVSLGYLFFYNMMSVLYLVYIDSKTKLESFRKFIIAYVHIMMVFYFVVIFSSPWTHWVAYFDDNGKYLHGSFMSVLYILPFISFAIEIVMLLNAKNRINLYQIGASISLVIATGIVIAFTIINTRLLIGQLIMATIMFFVYLAFENPAYYTYKDTPCLNDVALRKNLKAPKKNNKCGPVLCAIKNYKFIEVNNGIHVVDNLNRTICNKLCKELKNHIYCLEGQYFVVCTNADKEEKVISKIQDIFAAPFAVGEANSQISCELFLTTVRDLTNDFSYMDKFKILLTKLKEWDDTYSSKEILERIEKKEKHEAQVLKEIKNAIENDKFEVYYQPIYSCQHKNFHSAEALIRLFSDEIGFINPEEMIVLAEKNGYIHEVGKIVFEKVCKFISESDLKKNGIDYIEVNLSPVQCNHENLVEDFLNIMKKYSVSPEQINLEITETADSMYLTRVNENIQKFKELGISFSIDDFGSGFASLNYLIKFPVSIIKIDKEILWNAMKNKQAMIVLKNTICMAKELDKEIVVEGVEDLDMIQILNQLECDYHQGYFYSKPIAEKEFVEFIHARNNLFHG